MGLNQFPAVVQESKTGQNKGTKADHIVTDVGKCFIAIWIFIVRRTAKRRYGLVKPGKTLRKDHGSDEQQEKTPVTRI